MKISKLFHWLYAFLMFLPIVLFIPNAFYFGFNEHATAQTSEVNTTIETETTEANNYENATILPTNNSEIETNKMYLWDTRSIGPVMSGYVNLSYINIVKYSNGVTITDRQGNVQIYNFLNQMNFDTGTQRYAVNPNNDYLVALIMISNEPQNWNNCYTGVSLINFTVNQSLTSETITTTTEQSYTLDISNSMYLAWQSTWNLPLLQWTHTSFVAQPFTYLTGLFGVPSDSTFNYLFTYFVSISICWLVFDLLMYVPNLAHRWLDKGALE